MLRHRLPGCRLRDQLRVGLKCLLKEVQLLSQLGTLEVMSPAFSAWKSRQASLQSFMVCFSTRYTGLLGLKDEIMICKHQHVVRAAIVCRSAAAASTIPSLWSPGLLGRERNPTGEALPACNQKAQAVLGTLRIAPNNHTTRSRCSPQTVPPGNYFWQWPRFPARRHAQNNIGQPVGTTEGERDSDKLVPFSIYWRAREPRGPIEEGGQSQESVKNAEESKR